jgi:hypothetical protein
LPAGSVRLAPQLHAADGQDHQRRDEEQPYMGDPARDAREQDQHPGDRPQPVQRGRGERGHRSERGRGNGQQLRLSLYFTGGWVKVEIALARGRRSFDKRQAIAQRDADREIARELSDRLRGRRRRARGPG